MAIRKIRDTQLEITWKTPVLTIISENIDFNAAPDNIDNALTLSNGDRVLCIAQTDPIENGIYVVVSAGSGSDGVWERADDWAVGEQIIKHTSVYVSNGYFADSLPRASGGLVGTDPMSFTVPVFTTRAVHITEDLSSQVGGGNIEFITNHEFYAPGPIAITGTQADNCSIDVYLNGIQLQAGVDYGHNGSNIVTMAFAPKASPGNPDKVRIHLIDMPT